MSKNIFKYELDPTGDWIAIQEGAEILSVGVQNSNIMMWALVDPERPMIQRKFNVYGTGHKIHYPGKFIGTVFMDNLVFHVYDGGPLK